jgi:hypothetical protein
MTISALENIGWRAEVVERIERIDGADVDGRWRHRMSKEMVFTQVGSRRPAADPRVMRLYRGFLARISGD